MKLLQYTLGAFFVLFGLTKIVPIFGFGYGYGGTVWFVGEAMGYPMPNLFVGGAIIVELLLGLALLLPAFTDQCWKRVRYSAYGLALFTAAATLLFHVPAISGETLTPELTTSLKNVVIIAALIAIGNSSTPKEEA